MDLKRKAGAGSQAWRPSSKMAKRERKRRAKKRSEEEATNALEPQTTTELNASSAEEEENEEGEGDVPWHSQAGDGASHAAGEEVVSIRRQRMRRKRRKRQTEGGAEATRANDARGESARSMGAEAAAGHGPAAVFTDAESLEIVASATEAGSNTEPGRPSGGESEDVDDDEGSDGSETSNNDGSGGSDAMIDLDLRREADLASLGLPTTFEAADHKVQAPGALAFTRGVCRISE